MQSFKLIFQKDEFSYDTPKINRIKLMNIISKACGDYATNCYIVAIEGKEIIIDPGQDAASWVRDHVSHPVAILNTHGHFDHVWSNASLQKEFNIPLYAPKADLFMLKDDIVGYGMPPSSADVVVEGDQTLSIDDIEVSFLHFPGHTPGCSVIVIENTMFSGDFIFQNSIGRYDFPYSNAGQMKQSLERFLTLKENMEVYPGHGGKTTIVAEQANIPHWLRYF